MFRTAIAAALMLTPAIASAQLGAGIGTDAYAHRHNPDLDPTSRAAGTPMHQSHVEHYRAQQADEAAAARGRAADAPRTTMTNG